VEGLSIDEAFLDVRGLQRIAGPAARHRRRLRHQVLERVGLPITSGWRGRSSWPRWRAPWPSPTACWWCRRTASSPCLHLLPVERLWGVGPATAAKLHDHGITSVGEVARLAEPALVALVGRAAGASSTRWPTTAIRGR
jgi:DNA polymerase-4